MAVYTSGDWHVKPGREQEFVGAWRELAEWSRRLVGQWAFLILSA